jgi:hypothetical protein
MGAESGREIIVLGFGSGVFSVCENETEYEKEDQGAKGGQALEGETVVG